MWVEPATVDEYGYPVQERGVTDVPGLYFVGPGSLHTSAPGLLFGVGRDAEHVADQGSSRVVGSAVGA